MALQKSTVPLLVGSVGVDTGKDPKTNGQALSKLENGVWERDGSVGKRRGTTQLSGGYDGARLGTNAGRPLIYGTSARKHNGATPTSGGFSTIGAMSMMDIDLQSLEASTHISGVQVSQWHTMAEAGSVKVLAYTYWGAGTYYGRINAYHRYSGMLLATHEVTLATVNRIVRVIESGGNLYYFYLHGANKRLYYGTINTTTGAIGAAGEVSVLTADGFIDYFDACHVGDATTDRIVITYTNDWNALGQGWVQSVSLVNGNFDGMYIDAWGNEGFEAFSDISAVIKWSDSKFLVMWEGPLTTQIHVQILNASNHTFYSERYTPIDLNATSTGCTRLTAVKTDTRTAMVYVCHREGGGGAACSEIIHRNSVFDSQVLATPPLDPTLYVLTTGTDEEFQRKALILAKPFGTEVTYGEESHHYVPCAISQNGEPRGRYAVFHDSGQVVARAVEGASLEKCTGTVAGIYGGGTYSLPNVLDSYPTGLAGEWRYCAHKIVSALGHLSANQVTVSEGIELAQCPEVHDSTAIPNGSPLYTDGREICEQDFLVPPYVGASIRGPFIGGLSAGNYQYAAILEWTDANGNLHQSTPFVMSGVMVSAGGEDANVTVASYNPTQRSASTDGNSVIIAVYRTEANGTTFYRLVGLEQRNDTTVDTIGFVDQLTDATIRSNPEIYSDGSVLENVKPPSYRVSTIHQTRQVVADREYEQSRIYYSKPFVDGVGIEHNDSLVISIAEDGGRITALASMLDRLLVFKGQSIHAVFGNGLSNSGGPSAYYKGYSEPVLISEAIGCIAQATVVMTPAGLMFQSEQGIYLLDKTFKVTPIGDPVKYWTDTLTLTRGVMLPQESQAVWFTSDGFALVYDFLHGRWSTWTRHEAQDAVVTEAGGLYMVSEAASGFSAGVVRVRDTTTYKDSAYSVALTLESGWISLAKVGGYKRLYKTLLIGQNLTDATLNLAFQFDGDPYWHPAQQFDLSTLTTFDVGSYLGDGEVAGYLEQAMILEAVPPSGYAKATSFRFKIWDSAQTSSDNSPSFSISAVVALVGLKTGVPNTGPARRME